MRAISGRVLSVLCAALSLAVAASCDSGGPPTSAASPGATARVSASSSPSAPADITLAFAGDVHFTQRTANLLANPSAAFGSVADVFAKADVTMVNLETAVTERGTPQPKEYHFRTPATAFDALRAAHVSLVTIANNHILDYGQVGLLDTLDAAAAANFPVVGAGRNVTEAYAPRIITVRGVRIAFVAMSQIHELESSWKALDNRPGEAMASDIARSVAAVKAARQQADVVIVYVHWGQEGNQCPIAEQKTFAATMAEAGADAVIGTHAHLLLGDGWIGKTYVQYGLGNFLWWYNDAYSNDTGVLELTLHDKKIVKTSLVPAEIDRNTGQPIPVSGSEANRISTKYANLRSCTGLAAAPSG